MKSKKICKAVWDFVSYDEEDKESLRFENPALRYLSEEQAKEWIRFGTFGNIHTLSDELELLVSNFPKALPKNRKITLIDLGCGDGISSAKTIRLLFDHEYDIADYYAIDFNQTLIDITAERVCSLGGLPISKFHSCCASFETLIENKSFPWRAEQQTNNNSNVLQFFLGNTYNNFEPEKITKLLQALVAYNERVIIGVKVRPSFSTLDAERIIHEYQSFGNAFTFSFGHLLGLRDEEMTREVIYNSALNCLEIWLHTSKEIIPPTMPDIRATKLLVFKSYRPTIEEIHAQLRTLFISKCWRSKNSDDAIFYCKRENEF